MGKTGNSAAKRDANRRAEEMHQAQLTSMSAATEAAAKANATMAAAVEAQTEAMRAANDIAEKQLAMASDRYNHWKTFFKPIEMRIAVDAEQGVDVGGAMSRASSDVGAAFDRAGQVQQRNIERMGINPNSGRYISSLRDVQIARAAADAGVRNQARLQADQTNWDRRLQAAAIGSGIPIQSANQMQGAAGTILQGGSAVAGMTANQAQGQMNTAQLHNQQAGIALNSYQFERKLADSYRSGGVAGAIGGAIGGGLMGFAMTGHPLGAAAGAVGGAASGYN